MGQNMTKERQVEYNVEMISNHQEGSERRRYRVPWYEFGPLENTFELTRNQPRNFVKRYDERRLKRAKKSDR